MKELHPDQYRRIEPLVHGSGMSSHLAFVYELLEIRKKGTIYVDQSDQPKTALVCNETGFFFAFGEPDESIVRPTLEDLGNYKEWPYIAGLFASTPAWNGVLEQTLLPLGASRTGRLGFELLAKPEPPAIPDGYTLEPISAALAETILDGTGTDGYGIDPWFIHICGGAEGYAAHNLGLALMYQGQIASLCGFCALANGEVELELGTVPAHRGKNLALVVSLAFMNQCERLGLRPVYTCTSTNTPSVSVAHKLGYKEVEEIVGYILPRNADQE